MGGVSARHVAVGGVASPERGGVTSNEFAGGVAARESTAIGREAVVESPGSGRGLGVGVPGSISLSVSTITTCEFVELCAVRAAATLIASDREGDGRSASESSSRMGPRSSVGVDIAMGVDASKKDLAPCILVIGVCSPTSRKDMRYGTSVVGVSASKKESRLSGTDNI